MRKANKFFVLTLLSVLLFGFYSCSTETKQDCEVNKYCTVEITNTSSNPYNIYINKSFVMKLFGNQKSGNIKVKEGNGIEFFAEQSSGYILYPTTKTSILNLVRCSKYTWQIP